MSRPMTTLMHDRGKQRPELSHAHDRYAMLSESRLEVCVRVLMVRLKAGPKLTRLKSLRVTYVNLTLKVCVSFLTQKKKGLRVICVSGVLRMS